MKTIDWSKLGPNESWGPWRFDTPRLCLVHQHMGYEIDLESINSCAQMLDWIMHLDGKNADLYQQHWTTTAFNEIFQPRKNCCSRGIEKTFSGSSLAKQHAQKLSDAGIKSWTYLATT